MNTNDIQNPGFASDDEAPPTEPMPKLRRGFAAMSPEKVREIAVKGGKAAHEKGTAHRFTTEEARAAGRKGGSAPRTAPRPRKAVTSSHPHDPPPTSEAGGAE